MRSSTYRILFIAVAIVFALLLIRSIHQLPLSSPKTNSEQTAEETNADGSDAAETTPGLLDAVIPTEAEYVPQQLLVQFVQGFTEGQVSELVRQVGASLLATSPRTGNLRVISLPDNLPVPVAQRIFSGLDGVELSEPNYIYRAQLMPI